MPILIKPNAKPLEQLSAYHEWLSSKVEHWRKQLGDQESLRGDGTNPHHEPAWKEAEAEAFDDL